MKCFFRIRSNCEMRNVNNKYIVCSVILLRHCKQTSRTQRNALTILSLCSLQIHITPCNLLFHIVIAYELPQFRFKLKF